MAKSLVAILLALLTGLGFSQRANQDDDELIAKLLEQSREALPQRTGRWQCVVTVRKPDALHYGQQVAETPNLPVLAATVVCDPENQASFYQSLVLTKNDRDESTVMITEERFVGDRSIRRMNSVAPAWITADGRLDDRSLERVTQQRPPITTDEPTGAKRDLVGRIGVNPYSAFYGLLTSPTGYINLHDEDIKTEFRAVHNDDGSVWLVHESTDFKLLFRESKLVEWQLAYGPSEERQHWTARIQERNEDGTVKSYSITRQGAPDNPLTVKLLFADASDRDTSFQLYEANDAK